MDGAVADGRGYPFPLITTISPDVIGNLTKNLKSYIKEKGKRRDAILATTQDLSAKQRRNLEKRAKELGFVLLQTYDQNAFADRLYNSPRWCLELLGLTGIPSPLSSVPLSARPFINVTAVGRQEDIKWLIESRGDRLLVGQPGSGKTFLLRLLTQHKALFVIRKDTSKIASAIRSQKPTALIVDDVQHVDTSFLTELVHLRTEIGASFGIIASCWPGTKERIISTLSLSASKVHELESLTRDQIVEVIKQVGIKGPIELIREIVNQAEGRPGLAVTLSYLCLNGDINKVALGDALSASILNTFEPVSGKKVGPVLASFAIGGNAGMPLRVVAHYLGQSDLDINEIVTHLAWGGIISQNNRLETLSVRPALLRLALVRDTFYRGPAPLDPTELIANAPDLKEVTFTLIGAKARGASVPQGKLLTLIENARSDEVWGAYAWLGRDEANTILERYPEKISRMANPLLQRTPETAIPLLLKAAVGDWRPLHSSPEHPLRKIDDWIKESRPGSGQVIERRKTLLKAIKTAAFGGVNESTCLKALVSVFSLTYQDHYTDPGLGNTVTIVSGSVALHELKRIGDLWPEAFSLISNIKTPDVSLILEVVREVAFPGPFRGEVEQGFHETGKAIAIQMVSDLASLPNVRLGLLYGLITIARKLRFKLKADIDKDFLALFPLREYPNWKEAQERWTKQVRFLAQRLAKENPECIVRKIVYFETEANAAGITWPRLTPFLSGEIANTTSACLTWVETMIATDASGDLIEPFLRKAAMNNETNWGKSALKCLEKDNLKYTAITIVLTISSPPKGLLNKVLSNLAGSSDMIETLCARKEVPEETLLKLLSHPDPSVAGKAAIGEWQADPLGEIRSNLSTMWRDAILKLDNYDYWLGKILEKDPELSYEWLKSHISEREIPYEMEKIYRVAITPLSEEKRKELLQMVPEDFWHPEIINYLIKDSLSVYRALIKDTKKKDFHLLPLHCFQGETIGEETWEEEPWVAKARLALEAGYTPEELFNAIIGHHWSWEGNESGMWHRWLGRFESLSKNEDPDIQEVGKTGMKNVIDRMNHALQREKEEAIHGR